MSGLSGGIERTSERKEAIFTDAGAAAVEGCAQG